MASDSCPSIHYYEMSTEQPSISLRTTSNRRSVVAVEGNRIGCSTQILSKPRGRSLEQASARPAQRRAKGAETLQQGLGPSGHASQLPACMPAPPAAQRPARAHGYWPEPYMAALSMRVGTCAPVSTSRSSRIGSASRDVLVMNASRHAAACAAVRRGMQ